MGRRSEFGDRVFAAPAVPVDACHTLAPTRIGGLFHLSLCNLCEQASAGFAEGVWTALRKWDEKAQRPEREL